MSSPQTLPEAGYFDRHSGLFCVAIGASLLLFTVGLFLVWYGLAIGGETTLYAGIHIVAFPTELAILSSLASGQRGIGFRRIRVKTHSMWLLMNELFRGITSIDVTFAAAGALVPTLLLFSPTVVKSGMLTENKVAIVWAAMAGLALFSVVYGRCLMQTIGMEYETIGGGSLRGAAAYGALASYKFRNKKSDGLYYLLAAFGHIKGAFNSRRSRLTSVDSARLVVRSMLDDRENIPFDKLEVFAKQIMGLPSLLELPSDLRYSS